MDHEKIILNSSIQNSGTQGTLNRHVHSQVAERDRKRDERRPVGECLFILFLLSLMSYRQLVINLF